ncbi:hypothetical protein MRB53_032548 [Persea americana]|uniref:Uncharacterized protein n=1 Tax=Persea americana TaxID=3435 RepID=A0ACC2KSE5_PERAE|nr:hypothetical protein MRB53_032548 [Persea americana]|eukprot:TRINITY_DN7480_c0_g1_i5.p1 TRINITY_DN7480_c0_g1~~TRINITY_DN7480_c0_g1_i5.p1  ORF type:complete len:421 (+),score=53.70 TRINITY_DN7480_c0_g1_i5:224-1486(+)
MSRRYYGDRFIPARSSIDFDLANFLLVGSRSQSQTRQEKTDDTLYRQRLSALMTMRNRNRILSFWSNPISGDFQTDLSDFAEKKPSKGRRYIPKSAERILSAPEILDDYNLNLIDWSSSNYLAIALSHRVCLWDATNGVGFDFMSINGDIGPITSVSWAPDGQRIAMGMNNSTVELWDVTSSQKLRTLQGGHQSRVGSLCWNDHVLTTGGKDSIIIDNDVRIRSHHVRTYKGHKAEVCQLKWSNSGKQLASGGNDSLLYIWDRSLASRWLHKFEDHMSTVKAIAWCPLQSNLLASSGGAGDQSIKFWNAQTGVCLNSCDTGSQVCSLLWSKSNKEILSSHGPTQNQLTLWKYPSMAKIAELTGHTSRVLFMTQSPDSCMVASAAADETLRIWKVFETPEVAMLTTETTYAEPFRNLNYIR